MSQVARVAILGAESSGKSTLAAALADHYGTVWVPEYLREFVEIEARVPDESDQFGIARTQTVP
jgi:nicotinamide riboside kinase